MRAALILGIALAGLATAPTAAASDAAPALCDLVEPCELPVPDPTDPVDLCEHLVSVDPCVLPVIDPCAHLVCHQD